MWPERKTGQGKQWKLRSRPGEMDQSVKSLFCKHKDLSSNPRTCTKKAGMMECPCNPTTGEVEIDRSLGLASQTA